MAQQHNQPARGHVVSFAFIFAVLMGYSAASSAVEHFETPVGFNVSLTGAAT